MKEICENCAYSREYEPYAGQGCPYLICDTEGQVTRWQNCDCWRRKEYYDGQAKGTDS